MSFFKEFQSLDKIGMQFNTNKSSAWVNAQGEQIEHTSLLHKYEFFLHKYKDVENFKMLELGAGPDINIGASCRMWKDLSLIHI